MGIYLNIKHLDELAEATSWAGCILRNDDPADPGMFSMGYQNYAAGVLGRFISRDPIGHSGGLNLYAYPTNPVTHVDPSGLKIRLTGPSRNDIDKFVDYLSQATGTNYSCGADGVLSREGGSTNSNFSLFISLAVADQHLTTDIRVVGDSASVDFGLARGQDLRGAGTPYDNIHKVDIADLGGLIKQNSHVGLGKVVHETCEAVLLSRHSTLGAAQRGFNSAHEDAIRTGENGCHTTRGSGHFRNWSRQRPGGQVEEYFGPVNAWERRHPIDFTLRYDRGGVPINARILR